MKVILLQDIRGLGKRNEVKDVADGYARNFLIPKKLAVIATPAAINKLQLIQQAEAKSLAEKQEIIEQLQSATAAEPLLFEVKTGEGGAIFGSVNQDLIKEKLLARFPKLQKTNLKIETRPPKTLGRHQLTINLGQGIRGEITLELTPQPPSPSAENRQNGF
jgi:large subunit ribosomal protein L9